MKISLDRVKESFYMHLHVHVLGKRKMCHWAIFVTEFLLLLYNILYKSLIEKFPGECNAVNSAKVEFAQVE